MAERKYIYAIGRRKESSVVVKLFPKWTGNYNIFSRNNEKSEPKTLEQFFGGNKYLYELAISPFKLLDKDLLSKYDADVIISGGGIAWVADSIRLGFARAIVIENEKKRIELKPYWLLKRDSRIKERKKFWLKKARKAPKRSKR